MIKKKNHKLTVLPNACLTSFKNKKWEIMLIWVRKTDRREWVSEDKMLIAYEGKRNKG